MRADAFAAAIADWSQPLPHPRSGLYRNAIAASLTEALRVRYPVTAGLMGEKAFAALAGRYASGYLPQSPVLIGYGALLPDFMSGPEVAGERPFLVDVTRLENLWWLAYHAAEAEALPLTALAAVAPEDWAGMRLAFHPSVRLLASPYAVASIWESWREGRSLPDSDLRQSEWVLIARPLAEVGVYRISPSTFDFFAGLLDGETLAAAAEDAIARHSGFELSSELSALVGLGIITGLSA